MGEASLLQSAEPLGLHHGVATRVCRASDVEARSDYAVYLNEVSAYRQVGRECSSPNPQTRKFGE